MPVTVSGHNEPAQVIPGFSPTLAESSARDLLGRVRKKALISGEDITEEEGCAFLELTGADAMDLLAIANRVRERYKGNTISLCSIVNAKSGHCPEECAFCAQSAMYDTSAPEYRMLSADEIVEAAKDSIRGGVREFSIVTSGRALEKEKEISILEEALERLSKEAPEVYRCASLGLVERSVLKRLKDAGLENCHHNLETARTHHANIVKTHSYEDEVEAVRRARAEGLRVCCGGIFGMGETRAQRVELAATLRELDVDAMPINFLNPIDGTPLEGKNDLTPLECLKIIAVFRLFLPGKDIFVCGGRERNLGELQNMMFFAGANGTMAGNYLVTTGRPVEQDLKMIEDLGMEVRGCER